jgi:hypothetical protein
MGSAAAIGSVQLRSRVVSDEVLKVLLGGLVTLVVGWLLFQGQEGGRRGRRRREIREELELIELLVDGSPVRQRLQIRVDRLLERYEPVTEPTAGLKARDWAGLVGVLAALAGLVIELAPALTLWGSLALGAAIGTVGAVAATVLESRREKRLEGLRREVEPTVEVANPAQPG